MSFKTVLVDLICSIPEDLHRRADRRRTYVYRHREGLRREGAPEAHIARFGQTDLAMADFLDALTGRRRDTCCDAHSGACEDMANDVCCWDCVDG